jgi:NADH-quinone oxidoreductase subunit L
MSLELIAVFAPLIGFLTVGLLGRIIGDRLSQLVTCGFMIAAAVSSVMLFQDVVLEGHVRVTMLATWMDVAGFTANWSIRADQLSVVMMNVITIVSACVHVYSVGYMSHDHSIPRFMAYLSLFTFAMMMLVTADNLLQIFFGWEGVGLASYLLIGFWHEKPSACSASIKAFIVNRVGDLGLVLGLFATFFVFGSIEFSSIFTAVPDKKDLIIPFLGYDVHALTLIGILLFIGAMGKSAQLGLHTWLPDAMEGPTPVSALIHAATMVTAGVFLVTRFSPLYDAAPDALMLVCIVGALTAFVAATIGLTQFDIKRVIAYSTMSQLGYMFFALGVGAYGAAMFHLVTHAFFKALLFLGAGSVIHAMDGEQDMRKMGGIWRKIPATHLMMVIGSLALCGVPYFAGYYSKDTILESAWAADSDVGRFAYWMGIAAAFMTAFYSWRLMSMTFYGKTRADHHTYDHAHESPAVMMIPLVVLAVGALFSGAYLYGGMVDGYAHHDTAAVHETVKGHDADHAKPMAHTASAAQSFTSYQEWSRDSFWGHSLVSRHDDTVAYAHGVPEWVAMTPTVAGGLGIFLALVIYLLVPGFPVWFSGVLRPLYNLSFYKWYFDQVYDVLFVRTARLLGCVFWKAGDGALIDGLGPNGSARVTRWGSMALSWLQTGYVYHYAFAMMGGVLVLVTWMALRLGLFAGLH